jgi:hypothetical protein
MAWKHFLASEFRCHGLNPDGSVHDCGLQAVDPSLVDILDDIRDHELADYPMVVTSGSRCPIHNADVGGKLNSEHLVQPDELTHAVDTDCRDDHMRFLLIKALLARGITRIEDGWRPDGTAWVHAGNSPYHPQEVLVHA